MEYCSGGDLAGYIRNHKACQQQRSSFGIPEATAQAFMQQLASGLRALWDMSLVHVRHPMDDPLRFALRLPGHQTLLHDSCLGMERWCCIKRERIKKLFEAASSLANSSMTELRSVFACESPCEGPGLALATLSTCCVG